MSDEMGMDVIDGKPSQELGYVQGMNVLLAPILLVMPELDAFFTFSCMLKHHCPRYVVKNLDGSHHGCELVAKCFPVADLELFTHVDARISNVELYAFPAIMTLMASLQPLGEVLRLWDAMIAFGLHLNVLLFVAHLIVNRSKLLAEPNDYKCVPNVMMSQLDACST